MKVFHVICEKCGASMVRSGSADSRVFVCPYCGNIAFTEESDRVKAARLKSDAMIAPYAFEYRKHCDFLESEKRMFPIRVGLIIGLALLLCVLLFFFLK